jgi:hypothetical protein
MKKILPASSTVELRKKPTKIFIICNLLITKYYSGHRIKEAEIGVARSAWAVRSTYRFKTRYFDVT